MKLIFKFLIIVVLSFLFFFKLDFTALTSYDEAWYADISRNLARTKNPFELSFNYSRFTDHPPLGFMLMLVPPLFIANQELAARIVPAFLGMLSIVLIYLSGKKISGPFVGLGAGAILLSSMWFMLRARSGNLDIIFLFGLMLSFYGLLKLKESQKYLYLATLGFIFAFLTKTLLGAGLLPVFIYSFWKNRHILKRSTILANLILVLVLITPWYLYNQLVDSNFLYHHFIEIGVRGESNAFQPSALKTSFLYLQIGIGKWYKLFFASIILSGFIWFKSKIDREKLIMIYLVLLGFALPLLFSSQVEVWHLIPVYFPIALLIAFVLIRTAQLCQNKLKYLPLLITFFILSLSAWQFYAFSNLIYPQTREFSSEKDIAQKASAYPSIHLMSYFYPAAVYYSGSKVIPVWFSENSYQEMQSLLNGVNVFIIDQQLFQDLERDKIPFSVIYNNEQYYLIK